MIPAMFLFAAASVSCPVMNVATAGGALGGEVQVTVNRAEKSPNYTCQFSRAEYELVIEVNTLAAPDQFAHFADRACQGGHEVVPLRAIGNEAIACSLGTGGQIVEKAVVRVRNQAFVIRMSAADKPADSKVIRSKTAELAEEVAGYLF
jgi:hypothetical protein